MLSKKDQAIKENILKPHTVKTFFNSVHIPAQDDAIIANSFEEFMKKLTDPCYLWQGVIDHVGYGEFGVYSATFGKKIPVKAHRFAYALAYGFEALPLGTINAKDRYVINHLCHNRACVNVKHLEVITDAENSSVQKRKPVNV